MISTNRVRNTVMFLLNKNNLGYISPTEYDYYSQLAQTAIFEDLFYDYAKWINNKTNRRANSAYSDIPKNLREMIDIFSTYTTTANFTYNPFDNLWSYTGNDFYRTENLSLINLQGKKRDVEEVQKNMINSLVNSTVNPPSLTFPIYEKVGSDYRVYPLVPTGFELQMLFIRTPKAPKWTYINVNGNPMYNASATDLQDFEIPESLYPRLVTKILQYSGLSLRESDVVQIENNEEMVQIQKQS